MCGDRPTVLDLSHASYLVIPGDGPSGLATIARLHVACVRATALRPVSSPRTVDAASRGGVGCVEFSGHGYGGGERMLTLGAERRRLGTWCTRVLAAPFHPPAGAAAAWNNGWYFESVRCGVFAAVPAPGRDGGRLVSHVPTGAQRRRPVEQGVRRRRLLMFMRVGYRHLPPAQCGSYAPQQQTKRRKHHNR
jgi:hypothetical protein